MNPDFPAKTGAGDKTQPRRVLIIKPSSLGDVVHTLPAVHALKLARPRWHLSWLINPEWAPMLEGNRDIDQVIPFPRNDFRGLQGMLRLRTWLHDVDFHDPELVLDFQGLTRSALLARWSGACQIHCLANAELLPRLLANQIVPVVHDEHAVERYLRMVTDLGIPVERPVQFPMPAGVKPAGVELPSEFLLIHPFSRGAGKSLNIEALTALCQQLAPLPVVIAGKSDTGFHAPHTCINLLNRTSLPQLIWLIRKASFTLSVDSGPMHIAAALTHRLLSIHTWSDPRRVGPYTPEAYVWKNGAIQQVNALGSHSGSAPFEMKHVADTVSFLRSQFACGPQTKV